MPATLATILSIASTVLADAPQVLDIVENAIAAFRAGDQAGIDKAHADAVALAQQYAPPGTVVT